jgi:uncharacterized membrane protein YfcA
MSRLSLQFKNVLTLIFSVLISAFVGASVRSFYQGSTLWIPLIAALSLVLCQIILMLVPSKEEEELAFFRELRMNKARQRQREEEEVSNTIVNQIQNGDLRSVEKWHAIRTKYYE